MGKSKWYTLAIICLAQILCCADNSIMFNSLSALVESFHSHVAAVQLANTLYPLIAGALMLSGGFLGLKIGWKKLLYIGLLIITCGELAAFVSPNMLFFTWTARVLAGLGASLVIPAAIGLIPATYSGKDLAIGFGALGAATGIAAALGPIVGGWIIDSFGWRTAFLTLAIVLAVTFAGALKIDEKTKQTLKIKFDILGTILFAFSMILITLSLTNISSWSFTIFISSLLIGIAALALFFIYEFKLEKKQEIVLFPSIFLKSKKALAGLVMTSLIFFIAGGLSFALVTYLQVVMGFNALHTGFVLTIFAAGIILFSIGTPILIKNPNPRKICQISVLLAFIAGLIVALAIKPTSLSFLFYIGIFTAGISNGLLSSQAGVIVTSSIPQSYAAQSGGIQGSMRNIGQAIGIAIIGVIMVSALTQSVKQDIVKNPQLQTIIDDVVKENHIKLTKTVAFINNKQIEDYFKNTKLGDAAKNSLIKVNTGSQLKALRITFISYSILILLFFMATFKIPVSYNKQKEGAS